MGMGGWGGGTVTFSSACTANHTCRVPVHWQFCASIHQVCQLLMSRKVFEPVCSRHHDSTKHTFEDSGGKLYCFPADASNVENEPPADDSDEDSLYDESDLPNCSIAKRYGCGWSVETKAPLLIILCLKYCKLGLRCWACDWCKPVGLLAVDLNHCRLSLHFHQQ